MQTDNLGEIIATGELFKQSTSGSKTWALRKFVLAGTYLIYFNKRGERKGQWDIVDCQVRRMAPEEVGTAAAKYAFAIVGQKKTHILCASSEKNRVAWVNLISEQIIEFKDILRRFLKTGEIIVGNGIVKKRNMFGIATNLRMLITNYPRVLMIDENTEVLTDQLSWDRTNPPSFIKVSDTKFKISHEKREFTLEDMENGTRYWEEVFKRFPNMRYFVPKRRISMVVDFQEQDKIDYFSERVRLDSMVEADPDFLKKRMSAGNAEQASNNLKFLTEAMGNIDELVKALTDKISDIDSAAEDPSVEVDEQDETTLQLLIERKTKRNQLSTLKDNVSVLSTNLQTLVQRSMEKGTTNFDVDAIESVISETSAMLVMLSRESTEPAAPQPNAATPAVVEEEAVFEDEVNKIEEILNTVREENEATEAMIETIETTDIKNDEVIESIYANYESIDVSEDVPITSSNFDAFDPVKRPSNWANIRLKRVLIREFVNRLEGVSEATITENRKLTAEEEEEIMTNEVINHGRLLNMDVLRKKVSVLQAAITVSEDNYLSSDPKKRPPAWQAVRLKRVVLKEDALRFNGVEENEIIKARTAKIMQEEKSMQNEIATHGQIVNLGGFDYNSIQPSDLLITPDTFDPDEATKRPKGWAEVRSKRVMYKEQFLRMERVDESSIIDGRAVRQEKEEAAMLREIKLTGKLANFGTERDLNDKLITVAMLGITDENFDPTNYHKRPSGWEELKAKRVFVKELLDRLAGANDESISSMRVDREKKEEELMIEEALETRQAYTVVINETNFDASDPAIRPPGWQLLRSKRVAARERVDRVAGALDNEVTSKRESYIAAEEELMVSEVTQYGAPLVTNGLTKRKKGLYFLSNDHELIGNAHLFEFGLRKGVITKQILNNPDSAKPLGWEEIRTRRIAYRDNLDRLLGKSDEELSYLVDERKAREDALMIKEAKIFGNVFVNADGPIQFADLSYTAETYQPEDPDRRPPGWFTIRDKRVFARERMDRDKGIAEMVLANNRDLYVNQEENDMIQEMIKYSNVIIVGQGADFDFGQSILVPSKPETRPALWKDLKEKRIKSRRSNADVEEAIMLAELAAYDNVFLTDNLADVLITPENFSASDEKKRPAGWASLRARRALILSKGIQLNDRAAREKLLADEEATMLHEVETYGAVLTPERRTDFDITEESFEAKNTLKRPVGWANEKSLRLLYRGQSDLIKGITEKAIVQASVARAKQEEDAMVAAVLKYGSLLLLSGGRRIPPPTGVLKINPTTYDATGTKRPLGWSYVLMERVQARETASRNLGLSNESEILSTRESKEKEEEEKLIKEVEKYGNVLTYDKVGGSVDSFKGRRHLIFTKDNFDPVDQALRPTGWATTKMRRVLAKESNSSSKPNRADLERDEEYALTDEYAAYGTVLGLSTIAPAALVINKKTFDSSTAQRPSGWDALKLQRVIVKEQLDLTSGKSHDEILGKREERLTQEEAKMLREVAVYGNVFEVYGTISASDLITFGTFFDASRSQRRPIGWFDLRLKRVFAKESVLRTKGSSESSLLEDRKERLDSEETVMLEEVAQYGWVLNIDVGNESLGKNSNFDPANKNSRTSAWVDVRCKRLVAKLAFAKFADRSELEAGEDAAMVRELNTYGLVFAIPSRLNEETSLGVSSLQITFENFSSSDSTLRPPGWVELKTKRVNALEQVDRIAGISEEVIKSKREQREIDEESAMVSEVTSWLFANGTKVIRQQDAASKAVAKAGRKSMDIPKQIAVSSLIFTPENFIPEDRTKRPVGWDIVRMQRVIIKEQNDRLAGLDEEYIMSVRAQKEAEEEDLMVKEVLATGSVADALRQESQPKIPVVITKSNYEAWTLSKRPAGWEELRLKRIMLREHIDRIGGMSEDVIVGLRPEREVEEEITMIDEVTFMDRVLEVGEVNPTKITIETAPQIDLPKNFDPQNPIARPKGWKELMKTRVMVKEQYARLNGQSDDDIARGKSTREADEDYVMCQHLINHSSLSWLVAGTQQQVKQKFLLAQTAKLEINSATFDPKDKKKRPQGWDDVRQKRVNRRERLDRMRGLTESAIATKRPQRLEEEEELMIREIAKHGCLVGIGGVKASLLKNKFEKLENVEDIMNVSDENYDPNDISKRPKGWATVKLRRVYLKEWADRKEGLDDEAILAKRYQREQEAEVEMIQEMSVIGRIRRFEKLVTKNKAAALLPKGGFSYPVQAATALSVKAPETAREKLEKSAALTTFIKAANQTLESLTEKVADTLTEKTYDSMPAYVRSSIPETGKPIVKKNAYNPTGPAPRIIDTGKGPRGPRPIPKVDRESSIDGYSQTPSFSKAAMDLIRNSITVGKASLANNNSVTNRTDAAFKDLKTKKALQVADLGLTKDNYDPDDPLKRPVGWADLRLRRVEELEAKDRTYGIDAAIIDQMRSERLALEEEKMMEEAAVAHRVSQIEQATNKPAPTFFANLAAGRASSQKK